MTAALVGRCPCCGGPGALGTASMTFCRQCRRVWKETAPWTLTHEARRWREVASARIRTLWAQRARCFCGAHDPAPVDLLLAVIAARLPVPDDVEEGAPCLNA